MKTKILVESWDPQTNTATVVIQNKFGEFAGSAKCHPDDEEYLSTFSGSDLARARAFEKYYRFRAKKDLERAKEYMRIERDTRDFTNYNTKKYLKGRVNCYLDAAAMWSAKAGFVIDCWKLSEKDRRERLDKFRAKKKAKGLAEVASEKLKNAFEKYYGEENISLDKNDK